MDENSKTPTGSQAGSSSGSSLSDSNVSASAPAVGGPGDNLSTGSHAAAPVPTAANRGFAPAGRGEILAWAAYDIANATYGTVVATAIYNAYFVETICGTAKGFAATNGGFLLTLVIATSAAVIVLTAPVIGTIGDATAGKKKLLIASTVLCIFC